MVSGAPASAVAPRTTRDLVTRLRAGEPAVLEALISDHASRAWRLAHALTGDPRVAEAVGQAVIGGLLEGC